VWRIIAEPFRLLKRITNQQDRIMAEIKDIKDVLDGVASDVDVVKAGIDSLNSKIESLNASLSSSGALSAEDAALMNDTLTEAKGIKGKLDAMAAAFASPAAAPAAAAPDAPAAEAPPSGS